MLCEKPRIFWACDRHFAAVSQWLCYMPSRDMANLDLRAGVGTTPGEAYADWQRKVAFPQEVYA